MTMQNLQLHQALSFSQVKERFKSLSDDDGMEVKTSGHLVEALDRLSSTSYVELRRSYADADITIEGKKAGSLMAPDVNMIQELSTPSSFGKGSETVLDPAYRHGREIPAAKLGKDLDSFFKIFQDEVAAFLFVGREVEIKLYKLSIYEVGGHFDWHMDSTHGDDHHATFLITANTSWEGGDLVLRRNGVEMRPDMHPRISKSDPSSVRIRPVVFYTDTEHKVEPVTKGVRITFQCDVKVAGWKMVKDVDENEEEIEEDEDEDEEYLAQVQETNATRRSVRSHITTNEAAVQDVAAVLKGILKSGTGEAGFALQHLYRKAEFLKGSDALLYAALEDCCEITLQPVLLHQEVTEDGNQPIRAILFDHVEMPDNDDDMKSVSSAEEEKVKATTRDTPATSTLFHIHHASAIEMISHQEFIEYTGNAAMTGSSEYFGSGMFVRLQSSKE